jgi:predicted nucleic acid-binding protein
VICVDTSVWVAFFRGREARIAEHLRDLLDRDDVAIPVPVRIEILSGAARADLPRLHRLLSALPLLLPSGATWPCMETWAQRAAAVGLRFGVGDLIIAAIAAEQGMRVWSLDSDFDRMRKLGWIEMYG